MAKVLIQRELKRYRVDVRAIEQQTYSIYNYDPNDFLVNGMLELLDQYQRLEIALKLSRGRRKKAEQGGYAGGGAAFESWDMGHKPGYEFRKFQQNAQERGTSRQQFLNGYNNPTHYRPELPSSNRSHEGEDMSVNYFGP